MGDLPPSGHIIYSPQTAYCVVSAAHRFNLPVDGLLSILLVENGKLGMASPNKDGSHDLGPMQINTVWLREKSPLFGFVTEAQLRNDLCTNIHSAAWILSGEYKKVKDIWSAVGRYHAPNNAGYAWSYKTRVNSKLYQARYVMSQVPSYVQNIQVFFGPTAIQ